MISKNTIDEIKNRADILDVISEFVELKKSGNSWRGFSPFNNEKTPSFFVVPHKGIFKDFSSGKGGDVITFLMEHEKFTYQEAIIYLAKKYGIPVNQSNHKSDNIHHENQSIYITIKYAKNHYHQNLLSDVNKEALNYLINRGLTIETIKKFELGFASPNNSLINQTKQYGLTIDLIKKAGLVNQISNTKIEERFNNRIIFPIHNLLGNTIGFGARALKPIQNSKYINSPETELFHKSKVLYAIHLAKNEIRIKNMCFLVEGYMDAISMHQIGINNTVSCCGTALTKDQIQLIKRFTNNITIIMDNDNAGTNALLRNSMLCLENGLNVFFINIHPYKDPDELCTKHNNPHYYFNEPKDFIIYKAELQFQNPTDTLQNTEETIQLIKSIPDPIKRNIYLSQCSKIWNVDFETLQKKIKNNKIIQSNNTTDHNIISRNQTDILEKQILSTLINHGTKSVNIDNIDEKISSLILNEIKDINFQNPIHQSIINIIQKCDESLNTIDHFFILENCENTETRNLICELMTENNDLYSNDNHIDNKNSTMNLKIAFQTINNIINLKLRYIHELIQNNLIEIKKKENTEKIDELINKHTLMKSIEYQLKEAQKKYADYLYSLF